MTKTRKDPSMKSASAAIFKGARCAATALIAVAALAVSAQPASTYPNHPAVIISGFPAGGVVDLTLRLIADQFREIMGQSMVVETRIGASGGVALAYLKRQKPDGYTLSISSRAGMAQYWVTRGAIGYHPIDDFDYVCTLAAITPALLSKAGGPLKTLNDVIQAAKRDPGKLAFATNGHGSQFHASMEAFMKSAGIQMRHIPYKGDIQALTAVYTGEVDLGIASGTYTPWVEDKRINLVAGMLDKRYPKFPDTPTLAEAGHPVPAFAPITIAGPKGMEPQVLATLEGFCKKMSANAAFQEKLFSLGQLPLYLDAKDTLAWAVKQFPVEREIVERYGLVNPAAK